MVSITKTIVIDASPEVVRNTFLDLPSHATWDPFFVKFAIKGDDKTIKPGTQLDIDLKLDGSSSNNMTPTVLTNTAEELSWKGVLASDYVFGGTHSFKWNATGDGKTEVVQSEDFSGFLVPVFGVFGIMKKTEKGFNDLNEALKKEAERRLAL